METLFQPPKTDTPKLLPCPFCDGPATLFPSGGAKNFHAIASCRACNVFISRDQTPEVIAMWNNRPREGLPFAVQKTMTIDEINAAKTENGGWTRDTLSAWGVPWPPPKGWRMTLLRGERFEVARKKADE